MLVAAPIPRADPAEMVHVSRRAAWAAPWLAGGRRKTVTAPATPDLVYTSSSRLTMRLSKPCCTRFERGGPSRRGAPRPRSRPELHGDCEGGGALTRNSHS